MPERSTKYTFSDARKGNILKARFEVSSGLLSSLFKLKARFSSVVGYTLTHFCNFNLQLLLTRSTFLRPVWKIVFSKPVLKKISTELRLLKKNFILAQMDCAPKMTSGH